MTVTLKIEKNVYGGDGLGRLGDGRVVFVPGAFAGETVRAELTEQKKNFVRARCAEILERSPDRVDPGPTVPGMVYAGVNYAAELRHKQDQLGNFLGKIGLSYAHVEVVAGRSEHYRNKAVYHVRRAGGKWIMGYLREQSHDVVDVTADPLACEEINRALPQIRAGVFALLTQGAKNVRRSAAEAETVTVRFTPVDGVKWWLGDAPAGMSLTEQTAGLKFKVAADGFYQVNPKVGDELVKTVRADYLAGADNARNLADLYCGVGVFGLACAKADPSGLGRLVGVESVKSAVAFAKENAASLGVRANFFCERVGGNLKRIKVGAHTSVIVDPPRGGMEKGVPEWLAASSAPRIFCVSCDPATLVRDLAPIVKNYRVSRVKLFDMFPRTARFETLVELEK
ncbi:MAG: TRAM domain-containing protein [Kiritimatiellae bacterium]|nr:TRAM domain-containing protein [Kiritimatiellia bacterium]